MLRACTAADEDAIFAIINTAAKKYKGVIPADRYHEPYMSRERLGTEIDAGVVFWGIEENGTLAGIMGIQDIDDVTLIRHAYVDPKHQGKGIGGRLLTHLRSLTRRPVLIGTWAAASWAVGFYLKHGFTLVAPEERNRLLRRYWTIPPRQVETSVVLADKKWKIKKSQGHTSQSHRKSWH